MANFIAENYTLIIITIATMILGFTSGVLGTFLTLKKQALAGDALSHAALPGIVLAFMFTQNKSMYVLLLGALASASVAMLLLELIKRFSNIKYDAGLALILSSFFGFGQVLLLIVQTTGSGSSAGLNSFIFGQAATILKADVILIVVVSIIVLITVVLLWKELKLHIFDNEFYQSLGYNDRLTTIIFNIQIVIVVTISIRTVGVILMSALLIAPIVFSRQFSNRLKVNAILAGLTGLVSGIVGVYMSSSITNLSTGPVIVLVLSFFAITGLLFAPKRGIIHKSIRDIIYKKQIKKYHNLIHAYHHEGLLDDNIDLSMFKELGYVKLKDNNHYLTKKGIQKVESIIGGAR